MNGLDQDRLGACHWLLLRLAGTAPDDLLTQCRHWLGEGRVLDVGRAVTHAALAQRLRLTDDDLDLLTELLAADGADASALSLVDITDLDPMPMFGFAPSRDRAGATVGVAADGRPDAATGTAAPEDDVDRTAIAASAEHGQVRALWRAWRYPGDGAPWPRPRRVYVVETGRGADLVTVTAGLQRSLERAGESLPQVEVYPTQSASAGPTGWSGGELPSYQRLARAYGALLWSRDPDPGVRVAGLFDLVDERGPRMAPEHPVLDSAEAERLLGYLRAGEPLLVTAARMDDVVQPAQRAAVPMNFRTDGFWIWSEASTYYLERYGLAPDPDLLAHIQRCGYASPPVDGAALYRALAVLKAPSAAEPAWTYGP